MGAFLSCIAPTAIGQAAARGASQPSRSSRANSLLAEIKIHDCDKDVQNDIARAKSAHYLFQTVHGRSGEAQALAQIGELYRTIGHYESALPYLKEALALWKQSNSQQQLHTMMLLGDVYNNLAQPQQALEVLNDALQVSIQPEDKDTRAATFAVLGEVYAASDPNKAMNYFEKALHWGQDANDLKIQAMVLVDEGTVYDSSDPSKAIPAYERALTLANKINDCRDQAPALANMAIDYEGSGQPAKALDLETQAMQLEDKVGNESDHAKMVHQLAYIYEDMGDFEKALDFYQQALRLERTIGDRSAQGPTLSSIAGINKELHKTSAARKYYLEALSAIAPNNQQARLWALNNLGAVEADLGDRAQARNYYNQSIKLASVSGDAIAPAYSAWGIGSLEESDALPNYSRALVLSRQFNQPALEGQVNASLMDHFRINKEPDVAIFFGKQAVQKFQTIRQNLGSNNSLSTSFLAGKAQSYRALAQLLIDQGRLPEAQQILDLLKRQEYDDYTRGNGSDVLAPPSLTTAEKKAEADYQKATGEQVSFSQEWSDLNKLPARTAEQEKRYQELSALRAQTNRGLTQYYDRLYTLLGSGEAVNRRLSDVQGEAALLRQQIAKTPNAVALYTLVAKNRYNVMVVTSSTMVGREYNISEIELNRKIANFQDVLRDPTRDPRPLAEELYKIIVGPVKLDLDQAQPQTLIWALDGMLRYIPMSALYDGRQYLIQKYDIDTFTPASMPYLSLPPELKNVKAVAMGISRKYEKLAALPMVVDELDRIINDPNEQNARGVLPGSILLNEQFTEKAMESTLSKPHAIVHIASHFVFESGDADLSYLLLAGPDGESAFHLSVADFSANDQLSLSDTDLLTLSACETGKSGPAKNGREIDGLAAAAQKKGARAVISSLWRVYDESTGELMADFYKRWADNGNITKAEALRQAQLDLLTGKIEPNPAYSADAPASFAHPYYWAPFVLTGNWQ